MGVARAGIVAPLSATATRNIPWHQAGAGAGVYNTTRVVGSVVGAAAIGALMMSRLAANLPGVDTQNRGPEAHQLPWNLMELRHTFGSQLARKGVSLLKIAKLMGNSPEIAARHYINLVPEEMAEDVAF